MDNQRVALTWVEWCLMSVVVLIVFVVGVSKSKYGNNAGKTQASLLHLTISTVVTFSSSIAMLGVPSETWRYGFRYGLLGLSYFPMAYVVCRYFIPVMRDSQVVSSFEYLRERFNSSVSRFAVAVYLVQSLLYLSVTLYTPSLALSTVVNLPFNLILAALFFISTFTTVIGGMKAVLLTDVVFGVFMLTGQVAILVESFVNLPPGVNIYDLNATFDMPATIWEYDGSRYAFWDLVLGGFCMCLYLYGVNQASVHRYLSATNTKVATCSMWLTALALEIILVIGLCFGWLLKIHFPSPVLPLSVKSPDQLLMYYIFERYRYHPLFRSLFIGSMLAAALSTASSITAVISSTAYTDLIRATRLEDWLVIQCPSLRTHLGRLISFLTGIVCYICAIGIGKLGSTVIKLAMTNFGVCGGPILGIFILALSNKFSTSTGALMGMVSGLSITGMLGFGSVFGLEQFQIPFLWMTGIGALVTVLIGALGSLAFPDHLSTHLPGIPDRKRTPSKDFECN